MSIFDDKNKIKSVYFSFKTIGDKLEGTLVGKRVVNNVLRAGEEQIVYEIKKEDGEYIDVYGKPGIDMQMKRVKMGQIVGFEFIKQIPPKLPGYKPTNVVQVYADPTVVDQKWIMENEETVTQHNGEETHETPIVTEPKMTTEELLKEINNYAVVKLGARDVTEVKDKVMAKTNLAFIEPNLQAIWDTLQQLPV